MSNILASSAAAERTRITRPQLVSLLGPLISTGGIAWAILQPYRVTLLHPFGQGFWWLVAEPPLLVVAVGVVFTLVVAKPLLRDLEEHGGTAR
ncbi:MAG TPA: hypothetical protein VHC01_15560 [Gaiellaceae bacterium]|jgi:hypothetical protein|nr:hypothetical protein [Gaiellaceae bacterium]